MRFSGIRVVILMVLGLFVTLTVGPFDNVASLAWAQEKKVKVRPVERIAADAPRFVAGEVLVKFRHDVPEQAIEGLLKAGGARTLSVGPHTRYHRVAVPPGMPEEVYLKHLSAR